MKGLIFTDFLEMVSEVFSPEMTERIIDASHLPNQGAYTDIGTYDHEEVVRLITNLSAITGISVADLQIVYGKYLFTRLKDRYAKFILNADSVFKFLKHLDDHIHVEVLKLYPEAELPKFDYTMVNPTCMQLKYQSNRPFAKLAEGLIMGCAEHFDEKIHIEAQDLGATKEKKNNVLFTLTKQE